MRNKKTHLLISKRYKCEFMYYSLDVYYICCVTAAVAARFHISKYPTLKVIRNGQPTKREYRGQRSVEAFQEFIRKQLEDPIREFFDLRELNELDDKKRMIIGYFDRKDIPEYELFRKVATNLKDDCQFHVGFG